MTKLEEYIKDLKTVNAEYAKIARECSTQLATMQEAHKAELENAREESLKQAETKYQSVLAEKNEEIRRLENITNQIMSKVQTESGLIQKQLKDSRTSENNKLDDIFDKLKKKIEEEIEDLATKQTCRIEGLESKLESQKAAAEKAAADIIKQLEQLKQSLSESEDGDAEMQQYDEQSEQKTETDKEEPECVESESDIPSFEEEFCDELEDAQESSDHEEVSESDTTEHLFDPEPTPKIVVDLLEKMDEESWNDVFGKLSDPEERLKTVIVHRIKLGTLKEPKKFIKKIIKEMISGKNLDAKDWKELMKKIEEAIDE